MRDRVVVVTGGSRGLGRAIAQRLAAEGARVWAASRSAADGAPPQTSEVRPAQVDVGDEASVRRLFAAVHQASGRLDVLVACAGAGVFKPAVDISAAEWDEVLRTNLTGAFFCARESLRLMAAQGGGRIVFIGSIAGVMPLSGNAAYGASKYGLHGLAQILNEEGKASGVRVSIVHPGAVRSEMTAGRFAASDMLDASDVAETVLDIVRRPAHVRIDEVRIFPPKGVL